MFSRSWACVLPLTSLLSSTAFAQSSMTLEEVHVSANKRDQVLSRVDGSVSVSTADELRRAEVKNVSDLEKVFPGLVIRQRGNRAYSNFTVRGMSSPDFYNPTVQVYVDGVPQSDAFLTQQLVNVERVEFLRGPQGTLYGRNAYGGVLNIITRKPRENTVSGTAGGTNQTSFGDLYATGVYRDAFFTDIAVNGFGDRGQITDPRNGQKVDEVQNWTGKAQWRYAPVNSPFDAMFYVARDTLRSREENYLFDTQIDQKLYPVPTPYPSLTRNVNSSALVWNYNFGAVKFSNITSYQDVDLDRQLFGSRSPETTKSWSEEGRFTFDHGPVSGVAGFYYQDTEFTRTNLTGAYRRNAVDTTSKALFGEVTYALTTRLALTGGARMSWDDASIRYRGAFTFDNSADFTSVQPKASIGYQVTDDWRIYALVSKGYKPGGFNHAVSFVQDAVAYQPETAINYEIGTRNAFWNNRVQLSITGYHIDSKDKQIYVGVVPTMVIRNVGTASSTGVEVEATVRPTDLLTVTGSATYGVSKFDDYVDPFSGLNYSGNRIPYAPDTTVHLSARQVIPQNWLPGELAITGGAHHFGKTYFDEANSLGQDSYQTYDAGIEAGIKKGVVFKVFGTNLSDKIYRTYSFRSGANIMSNIGQGRLIGASVRGTF